MSQHSYTNPSTPRDDLKKVEAGDDDEGYGFAGAKTIIDEHGWRQRAPISDRACIRIALENSRYLAGLNRSQVEKLIKQYGGKVI